MTQPLRVVMAEYQSLQNLFDSINRLLARVGPVISNCKHCSPRGPCLDCIDALKTMAAVADNLTAVCNRMEQLAATSKGNA